MRALVGRTGASHICPRHNATAGCRWYIEREYAPPQLTSPLNAVCTKSMDDGASPQRQSNHGRPQAQKVKSSDEDENRLDAKRSKSGGILGGLSFLKSSKDIALQSSMADEAEEQNEGAESASSIATARRQSQGRKRTGSLRKAAMAKVRDEAKPRKFSDEHASPKSLAESRWPFAAGTDSVDAIERPTPQLLASPKAAPLEPYASTTDEEDTASFYRQSVSSSTSSFHATTQGPTMSLSRRRSNRSERRSTITTDEPALHSDLDDEWDYSETEWWGWIVLIVTWIVFVVGMGSCLGVWSWAWDVGETPYAPPELEDDPTLPITGYYPALIVCTAVMSWVWVVVAWVGMKYFRHAKVVGEEG